MKATEEGVSIITATMRKENIGRIISNFNNQNFDNKELIIIINNDDILKKDFIREAAFDKRIRVEKLPQDRKLGSCLNLGIEMAQYNHIAKFDDDDYYARNYLNEAYQALKNSGCDIVSKRSFFMYFMESKEMIMRSPITENQQYFRGAGATIFIKRSTWEQVQFNDFERGTDTDFFSRCKKQGLNNYVTSRYNYLCIRNKDLTQHTWQMTAEEIKAGREYTSKRISVKDAYRYVSRDNYRKV